MSSKIHADYDKVVTKKDLIKVFLREITYEHTWNYERMGNVGFCFSMYPVLKKLYPDKKDLAAAMKRHLTLYQTSHYLANFRWVSQPQWKRKMHRMQILIQIRLAQ